MTYKKKKSDDTEQIEEQVNNGKETEPAAEPPKKRGRPKKTEVVPAPAKKQDMRGRTGNWRKSPVIGDNGLMLEPGDNTRFITFMMKVMNLPEINIKDETQVRERIETFFLMCAQNDMKPTVTGLASSLGIDRRYMGNIAYDRPTGSSGYKAALPPSVSALIKKAYFQMEVLWENYMQNGKINPVSGIFLAKNYYGYRDQTDYVITPNDSRDSEYNAEDIRQRYLIDSGDSDSDSETPSDSGDSGDSERL